MDYQKCEWDLDSTNQVSKQHGQKCMCIYDNRVAKVGVAHTGLKFHILHAMH